MTFNNLVAKLKNKTPMEIGAVSPKLTAYEKIDCLLIIMMQRYTLVC